jgi:uncharacterized membrane protein YeaQ/YmgE (transglycosylase-associated protein family)
VVGFLISLFVVGLVVGAIARVLLPGRDPMGCLGTALVGIIGSLVGGLLADVVLGHPGQTPALHPAGLIGSVIGAIVVLLVLRQFRR